MKKFLKGFLISMCLIILVSLVYVLVTFPAVMRGMAAKVMCSCLYVSGRDRQSVIEKELQVFPGLADLNFDINNEDSTVTARLLWKGSKAIYRKGLGCTLLAEAEEEEVRSQKITTYASTFPQQDTVPWPTGDQNAFTNSENIDRGGIDKIVEAAFRETDPERRVNTHAIVVVYDGKIVSEKYADGFDKNSVLMGWSMTKSITNALVGILVMDGKLRLEAPAPLEEWKNDDRKNITLNNLLQASSGLEWSESYFDPSADFHNMFIRSDDKAAYAMSRKLEHTPGEYLEYSSGTTNILSKIIRQTVGDDSYYRFPYERLFSKIGMHHAILEPDASGTFVASSYGYASARDWARLGLLYLNDGVWNGERILPEGWVRYSTTPAPSALMREYGAQIWLNLGEKGNEENVKFPGLPHEAIIFSGFEDNFVVIIPSKNLVVVRLGVTHNDRFNIGDLVTGITDLLPGRDNLAGEL
jgi:CubicO group peptidase (beta-lactamase class C family)